MKKTALYLSLMMITFLFACTPSTESTETVVADESKPAEIIPGSKIVFVTGEREYRSEESMSMIAQLAKRELNADVKVCYALDTKGMIDPNITNNIVGLEALSSADLMVLYIGDQTLPEDQLKYILDYVDSGKPIVGFRTSTHAFNYKKDSEKEYLNEDWPREVFGQKWIADHGQFLDGVDPLTEVNFYTNQKEYPVLRGIKPFLAFSSLYHVENNGEPIYGDYVALLTGRSLRSNYAESQEYPTDNPVAWIKTYTGKSGSPARVFFTTLGHPDDFKESAMRKLSLNGVTWALGMEATIPADGFNVEIAGYEPSLIGVGDFYKKGQKPMVFQ
jgi:uncharacterized protein